MMPLVKGQAPPARMTAVRHFCGTILLVAIFCFCSVSGALATRAQPEILQASLPFYDMLRKAITQAWNGPSANVGTVRAFCVPQTSQYLERQEGRHKCAYDSPGGYRAVGVGYNLDEDPDQAKLQLGTLGLDYDKVYRGDQCLNNLQITSLLVLTSKRTLDMAAARAVALDEWCCSVQQVYADIAMTTWGSVKPWEEELLDFVEKTSTHRWDEAAKALEKTKWCEDFEDRCKDATSTLAKGCDDSTASSVQ